MEDFAPPKLNLNSLNTGIPALPPKKAEQRMEACVWCFLNSQHDNGVLMDVVGRNKDDDNKVEKRYQVCWNEDEIDREALFRGYNVDDGPEDGAEAIALLLVRERTNYTAIERSVTSTGIDYWLDHKEKQNDQIFTQASARLEISGILKQSSTNKPKYRVKKKIRQTRQSDDTYFPVYIIVVEFSQPITTMVLRNVAS